MKVEKSLRDKFDQQNEIATLVRVQFDRIATARAEHWHYARRIKTLESYALKVEAGIARADLYVDDFFACTFVVRNVSEISDAVAFVEKYCDVITRRPADDGRTRISPTDFQFDDLRLHVRLKPSARGDSPLNQFLFEVQIKTFLKHAWGVATHDLTYKTDEISWSKIRVASQIRAMLEHAELSIDQFSSLSSSSIIAKSHKEFDDEMAIIALVKARWEPGALPHDLRRLARALRHALKTLDVTFQQLEKYIDIDTAAGKGAMSANLSPYNSIMQAILGHHPPEAVLAPRASKGAVMVSSSKQLTVSVDKFEGSAIQFY